MTLPQNDPLYLVASPGIVPNYVPPNPNQAAISQALQAANTAQTTATYLNTLGALVTTTFTRVATLELTPSTPGFYLYTSGAEVGTVYERTATGDLLPHPELAPATQNQVQALTRTIPFRTYTPEQYGAAGDGVTDDHTAVWNACQALQAAGTGRLLLSQTYRIGRGIPSGAVAGILELKGGGPYTIEFTGAGALLMDNLNAGVGDQLSAIHLAPSATLDLTGVKILKPRIIWATKPTLRSQGNAINAKGYPLDTQKTIKGLYIEHPYIKWAPQAGIVLQGVSDPWVVAPHIVETLADGVHFNACRRPRVTGGVTADGVGDDALAFVTYYNAGGITTNGGTTGPYDPFMLPALGEWSNGGGYADKVVVRNGNTNAARLNGAYRVHIESVEANNTPAGVTVDGTKANGTTYMWTVQASRGCLFGRVVTDGASAPVLGLIQNVNKGTDSSDFYQMDVVFQSILTTNTTGAQSVRVSGAEGFRFGDINADKEVIFNQAANHINAARVAAPKLTMDTSTDVEVISATIAGTIGVNNATVRGSIWQSLNSQTDGLYVSGDSTVELTRLRVSLPNRSAAATARALLFARGQKCRIQFTDIVHDNAPLNALEIGGGADASTRSKDIDLGTITYVHTRATNVNDIVLQGGPYAPLHYAYSMRHSNDGGATWVTDSANTY